MSYGHQDDAALPLRHVRRPPSPPSMLADLVPPLEHEEAWRRATPASSAAGPMRLASRDVPPASTFQASSAR
jgi:hypothetical protein